jgi:hypothetical protein
MVSKRLSRESGPAVIKSVGSVSFEHFRSGINRVKISETVEKGPRRIIYRGKNKNPGRTSGIIPTASNENIFKMVWNIETSITNQRTRGMRIEANF